jgi:ABC-type phosphate transport system substrate-binding protein
MNISYKSILLIFFIISLAFQIKAEEIISSDKYYIVISNQNNFDGQLDQKALRGFFTLKRTIWPNGRSIQIITLNTDSTTHREFVEDQLKLFNYQVKRIWDRQIFSGSALTPIEVNNYKELINEISSNPGSIGYITQANIQAVKNENITLIAVK